MSVAVDVYKTVKTPSNFGVRVKKTVTLATVPRVGDYIGYDERSDFHSDAEPVAQIYLFSSPPRVAAVLKSDDGSQNRSKFISQLNWLGERGWKPEFVLYETVEEIKNTLGYEHLVECGVISAFGKLIVPNDEDVQVLESMGVCHSWVVLPATTRR